MATLKEISDGLAATVEAAASSVVEVRARRGKSATGIAWDKDHILTSIHAIENKDDVTVTYGDKSVSATVVGGLAFGLVEAFGQSIPGSGSVFANAIAFGLMVLVLVTRPQGLLGRLK